MQQLNFKPKSISITTNIRSPTHTQSPDTKNKNMVKPTNSPV